MSGAINGLSANEERLGYILDDITVILMTIGRSVGEMNERLNCGYVESNKSAPPPLEARGLMDTALTLREMASDIRFTLEANVAKL